MVKQARISNTIDGLFEALLTFTGGHMQVVSSDTFLGLLEKLTELEKSYIDKHESRSNNA